MNIQENLILERLKKARNDMGLSGDDVAKKIGKSDNSFISRVENGRTKLNIEIINKLCEIYNLNPTTLFAPIEGAQGLPVSNRKGFLENLEYRSDSGEITQATKNEIKTILPTLRKIGKLMKRLDEAPLTLDDFFSQNAQLLNPSSLTMAIKIGKKVAVQLRQHLNIGNDPIADIQILTWHILKVPICSLDLGEKCWGIYNKDAAGNPLIIYSSGHKTNQRNVFTIAHELGHHFFSPNETAIDTADSQENNFKEKMADAFAQELLVPSVSLDEYFKEEGLNLITLQQKHIVGLCQYFKVSYKMMLTVLLYNEKISKKEYEQQNNYNLTELKAYGYQPEKFIADPLNLTTLLNNLVAKGLRKEKFNSLFASEILDVTENEVKALL